MRLLQHRQMLRLLDQNLREWHEITRLDNTYLNCSQISADVLLMSGGRGDGRAVDLVVARLAEFAAAR